MMKAILFAPLVLLLVSSLLGEPGLERAAGFDVEHIEMPDQGHAGEPTLSHDAEGRLVATWIERHDEEARLMMARLTSGAWDSPRMLARGTNWFVNWAENYRSPQPNASDTYPRRRTLRPRTGLRCCAD